MKRLSIAFLLCFSCVAAIPVSTTWEVRSATGADTNGGGFDPSVAIPGQDFSQQAAAQVAFTDLIIGATTTQLTSALSPFATCTAGVGRCGNVINITGGAGCTVGWYVILSTSTITATMDRAVGTAASTCTGNMGGALAKLSKAVSLATQNNVIYATGSETITSTLSLSLTSAGGANAPFRVTGYNAARGDGGQFTLQTSTNSVVLITYVSGARDYVIQNLLLKSTAGTPGNGINAGTSGASNNLTLDNVRITGCNVGIWGPFNTQYYILPITLNSCEIDNCVSHGIDVSSVIYVLNSYVHDNGGDGLLLHAANQNYQTYAVVNSVFRSNVTGILQESNFPGIIMNSALLDNSSNGYQVTNSGFDSLTMINTIVDGNGTGFRSTAAVTGVFKNNATRANGTLLNNFPNLFEGSIVLSADPFTNRATGDFSLNNTAGGERGEPFLFLGRRGRLEGVGRAGLRVVPVSHRLDQQYVGGGGGTRGYTFSRNTPPKEGHLGIW